MKAENNASINSRLTEQRHMAPCRVYPVTGARSEMPLAVTLHCVTAQLFGLIATGEVR